MKAIGGPGHACGVSITFRGYLPGDELVHDVRRRAARLDAVDDIHVVIRADGAEFEVVLKASRRGGETLGQARHQDVRLAVTHAFERAAGGHCRNPEAAST
jgi:hypothetical protein